MKILQYPHQGLLVPTKPIEVWDREIHKTCQAMSFLLDQTDNGVGLAANQVGSPWRFFIYKYGNESRSHSVVLNPRVLYHEDLQFDVEGCLSFPDTSTLVARYRTIEVEYVDFPSMEVVKEVITGFRAAIFQHEIDHLDGVLLIDHLAGDRKNEFLERFTRNSRTRKNSPRRHYS